MKVPRDLSQLDEITADIFERHRHESPNAMRGG
jgi:hypothetical protein